MKSLQIAALVFVGLLSLILVISLIPPKRTTYPPDTPRCIPGPASTQGVVDWMSPHQHLDSDVEFELGGILFIIPAKLVRTAISPLSMNRRQDLFGIRVRANSLPILEGTACVDLAINMRVISASVCNREPGVYKCTTEQALSYAQRVNSRFDRPLEPNTNPNSLIRINPFQSVEEFIKNPTPTYEAMTEWQSQVEGRISEDALPNTVAWNISPFERLECDLPISGSEFSRHYFSNCTYTRIYDVDGMAAKVEFWVRARHFSEQAENLFYMADNFEELFQLKRADNTPTD